jgi:hypothetical protein
MIWGVHFTIGVLNGSVELYYDGRHSPVKIPNHTPKANTFRRNTPNDNIKNGLPVPLGN